MAHVNPRVVGSRGEFPVVRNIPVDADTHSIEFDNLAGDQAFIYKLTGFFTIGAADSIPEIILNNDTSSVYELLSSKLATTYAAVQNNADNSFSFMGGNVISFPQGTNCMIEIDIFAAALAGSGHIIQAQTFTDFGAAGTTYISTGEWADSSEITSIKLLMFSPFDGGRIKAGSRFQLSAMGLS